MGNPIICVDLSEHQTEFNFQSFKDGGGLGVILKASEGESLKDAKHPVFKEQALAAGLAITSYHYLRPGNMKAQAQFFLSIASPPPSSPIIAAHEDAGVSPDDLDAFLQAIQSQGPDLQLTVYSTHLIKQQLGSTRHDWLANNISLCAEWNTLQPTWPTVIWPILSLWQYTDRGRVPGFSGTLDCNSFRGSSQNFITIAS